MKPSPKRSTGNQHIRHTDQDSGDEVSDDTEDEFLGSIFNVEEKRKPESRKSGLSAPAVTVPLQIEDIQIEVDTGGQRFIEQMLAVLGETCVIMDDLLVGGSNDEGHLKKTKTTAVRVYGTICYLLWISLLRKGYLASGQKRQGHQRSTCPTQSDGFTILLGNVSSANQPHP